jgi:hypothetical protein
MAALKAAFRDATITSASVQYGPEGTDSGDIKATFEAVMVSYKKNSAVKDQVKWEAEFQITGRCHGSHLLTSDLRSDHHG